MCKKISPPRKLKKVLQNFTYHMSSAIYILLLDENMPACTRFFILIGNALWPPCQVYIYLKFVCVLSGC